MSVTYQYLTSVTYATSDSLWSHSHVSCEWHLTMKCVDVETSHSLWSDSLCLHFNPVYDIHHISCLLHTQISHSLGSDSLYLHFSLSDVIHMMHVNVIYMMNVFVSSVRYKRVRCDGCQMSFTWYTWICRESDQKEWDIAYVRDIRDGIAVT